MKKLYEKLINALITGLALGFSGYIFSMAFLYIYYSIFPPKIDPGLPAWYFIVVGIILIVAVYKMATWHKGVMDEFEKGSDKF